MCLTALDTRWQSSLQIVKPACGRNFVQLPFSEDTAVTAGSHAARPVGLNIIR